MAIILNGTQGTSTPGLYSTTTFTGTYTDGLVVDYTTGLGRISVGTSDGIAFYNAGVATTELMRLDASGNLGLGVTPSAWGAGERAFDIGAIGAVHTDGSSFTSLRNAYYNAGWKYKTTSAASRFNQGSDGSFYWAMASSGSAGTAITFTQAMTLDASGNLGVGVTSMKGRIGIVNQVDGGNYPSNYTGSSATAGQAVINAYYTGYEYVGSSAVYPRILDIAAVGQPDGTNGGGIIRFLTNPATANASAVERVRIDSSGNLLVGTTTANFNFSSGWNMLINSGASYTNTAHASGTSSGAGYANFIYNSGVIGSITQNGTTGVLYNLTSDYRLKNNPEALTGAKDFVMALQPKKWQWWDGSGEGVGFIAHEFMEVAKYSGNGTKDAVDEDGNPVYQSIQPSSSEVMANLVSLLQEQQAIIQQLQADVAALKG